MQNLAYRMVCRYCGKDLRSGQDFNAIEVLGICQSCAQKLIAEQNRQVEENKKKMLGAKAKHGKPQKMDFSKYGQEEPYRLAMLGAMIVELGLLTIITITSIAELVLLWRK